MKVPNLILKGAQMKVASLILLVSMLVVAGCYGDRDDSSDSQLSAMLDEDMACPDGAMAEIDAWGKNGLSRACKLKHGKFTGWEKGYKVYEVQYEYGKPVGKAYWYDEKGNITKEIDNQSQKNDYMDTHPKSSPATGNTTPTTGSQTHPKATGNTTTPAVQPKRPKIARPETN